MSRKLCITLLVLLSCGGCEAQKKLSSNVEQRTVDPIAQAKMLSYIQSMQTCGAEHDGNYSSCKDIASRIPETSPTTMTPPVVAVHQTGFTISINPRTGVWYQAISRNGNLTYTCKGDGHGCVKGYWGPSSGL